MRKFKIENLKLRIGLASKFYILHFPLSILLAALLLSSCEHREFEYGEKDTQAARVIVNVDWQKLLPYDKPSGMTIMIYPEKDVRSNGTRTYLCASTDQAVFNLYPGNYDIMVFNQSKDEFGTLSFNNLDDIESATIDAKEVSSRWYNIRSENEIIAEYPEWVAVGVKRGITVTDDMATSLFNLNKTKEVSTRANLIAEFVPDVIIRRKTIKITIHGINNLRSVRGSIPGLAAGLRLKDSRRHDHLVTHLLEDWELDIDKDDPKVGCVTSTFTCFGLPGNHGGQPEENLLQISFLLADNTTVVDYSFKIGHIIRDDEIEQTIYLDLDDTGKPVILPDVVPEGSPAGGFDGRVTDWENVDIEVGI